MKKVKETNADLHFITISTASPLAMSSIVEINSSKLNEL